MKLLLPALALVIFTFGCTKYEAEYLVVCQFQPFSFSEEKRILLVTNTNGDILHKFDLSEDEDQIQKQFSVEGQGLPDRYDLHLLNFSGSTNENIRVYSHLDIPNGGLVYFPSRYGNIQNLFIVNLRVEGVESFDSLQPIGGVSHPAPVFQPVEKNLLVQGGRLANHGIIIRLQANESSDFRHLYVPDSLIPLSYGDTLVVNWQDFKPENNMRTFEIPENSHLYSLEVTACLPDFKEFVTLERSFQTSIHDVTPRFNHPDGLSDPVAYRIRALSVYYSFEKIFQPGETLLFEPADMTIDNFGWHGRSVQVEATGDIDLIRIESNAYLPGANVSWIIDGSPEAFQNRILPDLSEYLPAWYFDPAILNSKYVGALQFGKYEYQQIREGFPTKLTDPYALARSGYQAVWKWY